jgi:deoxyribodipyrimidine photo-lyase
MNTVLLFHDEMLNPEHALLKLYPDAPRVFIFDTAQLERDGFSLRRIQFIADCVAEIPNIEVFKGLTQDILKTCDVDTVITQKTSQTHVLASLSDFKVHWHDEPHFVSFRGRLKRFMHYWKAVEPELIGTTPVLREPLSPPMEDPQASFPFKLSDAA